jgi:hypothetical protein
VRWLLVTGWQGATKEHSRQRSVTEEQRSQPVIRSQPSGLPIFATTASLFVSQRSLRIFSFLTPRGGGKSLATHPFPIYEMGSNKFKPGLDQLRLITLATRQATQSPSRRNSSAPSNGRG